MRHLTTALLASAFLLFGVLTIANPERLVARSNLGRFDRGKALDVAYLTTLGDDAIPTLARWVATHSDAAQASELKLWICSNPPSKVAWSAFNWSRSRAGHARDLLCGPAGRRAATGNR